METGIDWTTLLLSVVSALSSGGIVSAVYTARKSAEVGAASNEVEASKTLYGSLGEHSKQLQELWQAERDNSRAQAEKFQAQLNALSEKLETTRTRISRMERREVNATRYIEKLKEHIWQGNPPPPPQPDHDLDYN